MPIVVVIILLAFLALAVVLWVVAVAQLAQFKAGQVAWRERTLQAMKEEFAATVPSIKGKAIAQSKAVTVGKVIEHLVPYLPDFAWDPRDARFMGSPVDFIVFDGLGGEGDVTIVFVEVKTGKRAQLGPRQRRIKRAVEARRVEWETLHASYNERGMVE